MATKKETAAAVEEVQAVEELKPATKKTSKAAKAEDASAKKVTKKTTKKKEETLTVKLVRSAAHRLENQIATCKSLGLRRIGDVSVQPDNAATRGKLAKIAHLVEVTE
ncbi:MAG: 50S ribosomal protein L30 [Oscillospiraceae bacterium]|nr:50S ribosomal protein L30 [Oscillospiraceae bacterium]